MCNAYLIETNEIVQCAHTQTALEMWWETSNKRKIGIRKKGTKMHIAQTTFFLFTTKTHAHTHTLHNNYENEM